MELLVGLMILGGILAIPDMVVAMTPGAENQQKRILAFVALAVIGFVGVVLFSGFIETWRGYVSFLVGWLAWLSKMMTTPLAAGVSAHRSGSYPDPGGVATLLITASIMGIMLQFAFPD